MVADLLQSDFANATPDRSDEINVLANLAGWDWPLAVRDIFRPRGVNLLVADNNNDIVNVLRHRRIRMTIVDTDFEQSRSRKGCLTAEGRLTPERDTSRWTGGLSTLRIIRIERPELPCILLAKEVTETILEEALQLDVFSVIDKPVDMNILKDQLNRLFVKKYSSHIFSF
jgi:DNA-binding NarL/FixJ family response regulator